MNKTRMIIALSVLGMACGGSDNKNTAPIFSYGDLAPANSSQQAAAGSAESSLSSTLALQASPDSQAQSGTSVFALVDGLAGALSMQGYAAQVDGSASLAEQAKAGAQASLALAASAFEGSCQYVVVEGTITYTNCSAIVNELTITVGGTITASADGLSWNLTATASGTFNTNNGPVSIDVTFHESGDLKATTSTLQGWARSDVSASGSAQGQTVSLAYSTQVDVDLAFRPATEAVTFCIIDGTLEIRRWWTAIPNGADRQYFPNQGVKFVWSGDGSSCWNTLQVQYSQ